MFRTSTVDTALYLQELKGVEKDVLGLAYSIQEDYPALLICVVSIPNGLVIKGSHKHLAEEGLCSNLFLVLLTSGLITWIQKKLQLIWIDTTTTTKK